MNETKENIEEYDVAILGSGLGGSMLASILAKHGVKTLIVEAGTQPRFAIGEATTPDTSCRIKMLAHKYDVPEIENLAAFHDLNDKVSSACGVKRSFSFLYHRDGEEQVPDESHQFPTLSPPFGPDAHLFRQDTDFYMLSVATRYGADVKMQMKVTDVDINENGVDLKSESGQKFHAKFLVDGAGFRSPMADKMDLRDTDTELMTNSRSIFTHMVNVELYDQVGAPLKEYNAEYALSQATLHHVFEGGWYWVIPFNNHPESTNPLCSVGLMLNRDLYPETGMDAEEEFFHFTNKFPAMARQFKNARSVRPWVTTPRIQFMSKDMVGYRYALLAHAAGFIDPLYSSGLNITTSVIDGLAGRIIDSVKKDDYDVEKYAPVNQMFQDNIRHFDKMVGASFISFRDFDLWDAWFRVWVIGNYLGTLMNINLFLKYKITKDKKHLNMTETAPYQGSLAAFLPEHRDFFDKAYENILMVKEGKLDTKTAAQNIRDLIKEIDFFPKYYKWYDTNVRTTPPYTVGPLARIYAWYFLKAPKSVRKHTFGWSPYQGYKYVLKSIFKSNRNIRKKKWDYIRDVFKTKNQDWKKDWRPVKE